MIAQRTFVIALLFTASVAFYRFPPSVLPAQGSTQDVDQTGNAFGDTDHSVVAPSTDATTSDGIRNVINSFGYEFPGNVAPASTGG